MSSKIGGQPPVAPRPENNDQCAMPWESVARKRLRQRSLPRLKPGVGLSVMFPAYNDAETIGKLVDYSAELLPRVADDYQIVVVNDGSPDHTAQVLAERAARYPFLTVVNHLQNQGYGAALRSGFAAATKDLVFYTDGDGQYDPTEVVALLPHIEGCGMVNGCKMKRGDNLTRVVVGRLYHWTSKILFGLVVRDVDCDFRLIRRDVLASLPLTSRAGSICVELVRRVQESGSVIHEVPVHHYERVSGRSQFFRFKRVLSSLIMLLRLWRQIILVPALRRGLRFLSPRRVRGYTAR
jgi:glycosyltransferase involved in cell wall biosynthesis